MLARSYLARFSLLAAGNVPSCSAVYPNPADGGRECPVLLAPLVRILLSLAVKVGLFSAVCTYFACFSQSAGLFQPLSAQFSVRCRRFSRFSVKFRCFTSTTAGCRVRPCYPGWVIQVACVSFASFTAGSTLASAARLLYTCGLP